MFNSAMIISSAIGAKNSIFITNQRNIKIYTIPENLSRLKVLKPIERSINKQNPNTINNHITPKVNSFGHVTKTPFEISSRKGRKDNEFEERKENGEVGRKQMSLLCGFGFWMQGFRCFPWLALNYHMAYNLNLHPSVLQLVQHSGNLPMVAKPLYGVLSDAVCIGGAHRIPYILIGVLLQALSWGPLALITVIRDALPTLIACILASNLGASITEVAMDALVAEYGQRHGIGGLQSYAFMASAVGGILGNLVCGYFLLKTLPQNMFLIFAGLLSLQLLVSSTIQEDSLSLMPEPDSDLVSKSLWKSIGKQLSNLSEALSDDKISRPLTWLIASVATVPVLSGSIYCYQMQCLHLDPSVIGMSRTIGQLTLLLMTVLYDRFWKELPMRKLIGAVQFVYATSLLLDFMLVRQINLRLGTPSDVLVCCFSSLAEALAQFKLLPFSVLLASLCPPGSEGSLTSFLASTMCLSAIISGFLGVALASVIGITATDYSSLPMGILVQLVAALLPLAWIGNIPMSNAISASQRGKGLRKRTQKSRRIERPMLGSIFVYQHEREPETQG